MAVAELLDEARRGLDRLTPAAAARELGRGAILVDTRSAEHRQRDGVIPGSLVIDPNVVEWRLDPRSDHRVPEASGRAPRIIVICNEGYSSSLVAARLRRLGQARAADVVGGMQRWLSDGLPVLPGRRVRLDDDGVHRVPALRLEETTAGI